MATAWIASLHPDDVDRTLHDFRTALEQRASCSVEARIERHDGEYRNTLFTALPRQDADGAFAGYVASGVDVTDIRRVEQANAEHQSHLAHSLRGEPRPDGPGVGARAPPQPLAAISAATGAALRSLGTTTPDLRRIRVMMGETRAQAIRAGELLEEKREFIRKGNAHHLDYAASSDRPERDRRERGEAHASRRQAARDPARDGPRSGTAPREREPSSDPAGSHQRRAERSRGDEPRQRKRAHPADRNGEDIARHLPSSNSRSRARNLGRRRAPHVRRVLHDAYRRSRHGARDQSVDRRGARRQTGRGESSGRRRLLLGDASSCRPRRVAARRARIGRTVTGLRRALASATGPTPRSVRTWRTSSASEPASILW